MDSRVAPNPRAARARRASPPPRQGVDRAGLLAEMAALKRQKGEGELSLRVAGLEVVAAALNQGRAEARGLLEDGGKGLACAEQMSELQDDVIAAIHALALRQVQGEAPRDPGQPMT